MRRGLTEMEAEDLLNLSVQLAVEARDSFWVNPENRIGRQEPLVAASVGPYGAALADGSEYSGDYDRDEERLLQFHRRRWRILARSRADILACETLPSYAECQALIRLLIETPGRYAWFSFSCRDEHHISDGTPLADCARSLDQIEQVAAIGINCTAPQYIPKLIGEVRRVSDKPIVVYPNSGEQYEVERKAWVGAADSANFAESSKNWYSAGATVIGGCCRTGPDHIREIRQNLIGDE